MHFSTRAFFSTFIRKRKYFLFSSFFKLRFSNRCYFSIKALPDIPHRFSISGLNYCPSSASPGYILVVGLCSFAACYRHGPLADEWSRGLLMWTLRFLSLVLVYTGVAVPLFAYAVMVLLLFSWSLRYPLRAFSYLRWWVSFL